MPWVWSVVLATGLVGVIALARSGSLLFYRTHSAYDATRASIRSESEALKARDPASQTPPTAAALAPVAGLLLLVAGLVIWAGPLSDYASATAAQLLQPQHYIDAVLGTAARAPEGRVAGGVPLLAGTAP
jgi:multicomponent K+:H+ antiporter subunit D